MHSSSMPRSPLASVDVPALERQASLAVIATEVDSAVPRLFTNLIIHWPIMVMVRPDISSRRCPQIPCGGPLPRTPCANAHHLPRLGPMQQYESRFITP